MTNRGTFKNLSPLSLLTHFSSCYEDAHLQVLSESVSWSVYIEQGKITYASHSVNPLERLEYQMCRLDSQIPIDEETWARLRLALEAEPGSQSSQNPDYQAICWLVNQQYLNPVQAAALIEGLAKEAIELLLLVKTGTYELGIQRDALPRFCRLELQPLVKRCQQQLQGWQSLGPQIWSPHQRPYFLSQTRVQKRLLPEIEPKIRAMLKDFSFYQIAALMNQDALQLAQSLHPYIVNGTILLTEPHTPLTRLPKTFVQFDEQERRSAAVESQLNPDNAFFEMVSEMGKPNNKLTTPNSLSNQLHVWSQMKLTGRLDVQAGSIQPWSLYFCLGRLVWANGGLHWLRRWRRLLLQYCPQIQTQSASQVETEVIQGKDYNHLIQWVKQRQIVGEHAGSLIRSTVAEVLFDILQQEKMGQLTFVGDRQDSLDASLTLINPEQALSQAKLLWEEWSNAGLANLSPNLAPMLRQLELLQQQASPQVYQTLVKVIDGKRTLRDLALLFKQDLLLLSQTLIVYIRKGWMELVKIPDSLSRTPPQTKPGHKSENGVAQPSTQSASGVVPVIACVDDSNLEQQNMERILTQSGCRFVGIQDSVQALPSLLQHKPDLIFLDLVMPVANGYEICSQIRRISQFKNTPVVILTGNDGIVDRVRARIVGSTEFLGKPIEEERVLAVLRKYLSVPTWPHRALSNK